MIIKQNTFNNSIGSNVATLDPTPSAKGSIRNLKDISKKNTIIKEEESDDEKNT